MDLPSFKRGFPNQNNPTLPHLFYWYSFISLPQGGCPRFSVLFITVFIYCFSQNLIDESHKIKVIYIGNLTITPIFFSIGAFYKCYF